MRQEVAGKKSLKDFFSEVRRKYPNQMFMADRSTVGGDFADEIVFEFHWNYYGQLYKGE